MVVRELADDLPADEVTLTDDVILTVHPSWDM